MARTRKGKTGLEWLLEKGLPATEDGSAGAVVPEPSDAHANGAADVDAALAFLDKVPQPIASTVEAKPPAEAAFALDDEPTPPPRGDAKRGLDAVANALARGEAPKKPAESQRGADAPADESKPAPESWQTAPTTKRPATPPSPDAEPIVPPAEDPLAAVTAKHRKAVATGRSTRGHPRARATFEARFKKGSDAIAAAGRNVSMGGFFVETTKMLPDGEVFQAQLVFPDRKLSVIAEVMWCTLGDAENLERFPPGMGCKFLDVDDRDVPFLQGVIDASLAGGGEVP